MADNLTTTPILSLYATTGERIKELAVSDGQLSFVHDLHEIALDFNGKRTFYGQIERIATDSERVSILAPISGRYYFVVETAILWIFENEWVQVTTRPDDIIFVGSELPELGVKNKLYVSTSNGSENLYIWDEDLDDYKVIVDIAGKADKADTLAGYGITDAYTSAQTDSAIASAMALFTPATDEEILALFTTEA